MNTFDYLQISVPLPYVKNPNLKLLNRNEDVDGLITYSLRSGKTKISSHNLKILFNIGTNDATIGFSSKILGSNYPDLINIKNIKDCFNKLSNEYKLCDSFDIDNILNTAICQKIEVTSDIKTNDKLTKDNFQNITNLVADSKKWKTLTNDNGYVRKNGFGAMRSKGESIIIYGKEDEMKLSKNANFVSEFGLEDKFTGLTRVEVKLSNLKSIRKRFNSDKLIDILQSEKNTHIDVINEIFKIAGSVEEIKGNFITSQRDRERLSYAKEFNSDLSAISIDIRRRAGKNWKRDLEPFIKICKYEDKNVNSTIGIIDEIKSLLSMRNN